MGQSISLIGTWMQNMAMGWLVYRITSSVFMLGVVGFTSQIPAFVLSPLAGVYADRWDRRRILVVTQALAMIQAFLLAFLVLTGAVAVWHVIVLSMFLGLTFAFDGPVRHSFVVEMIETRDDLGNAIALNSLMFNAARLIGPSIAGILVAAIGEGACFLLNGFSYIAVIVSLSAMRIMSKEKARANGDVLEGFKEGFTYVFGSAPIRSIVLLLGLVSLLGMSYAVLMPVVARDILHGSAHTLGFLMGAAGMGALSGALYLASRRSVRGLGNVIVATTAVYGIGLVAFSFSHTLWLSLALLVMIGFGAMVHMGSSNIVLQTIVDDDKRGRVMSFYMMAFLGMAPIGSLLIGGLASRIGSPNTFVISGLACIAGSLMFSRRLALLKETAHRYNSEWASFMQ
jgi:MFS family permease